MKLFIWLQSRPLADYTGGMIVALAPDLEAAHRAIAKECDYATSYKPISDEVVELGDCPGVEPRAWLVWGGG